MRRASPAIHSRMAASTSSNPAGKRGARCGATTIGERAIAAVSVRRVRQSWFVETVIVALWLTLPTPVPVCGSPADSTLRLEIGMRGGPSKGEVAANSGHRL